MSANKRKGSEVFAERFKGLLANADKTVLCQKLDLTGETAFRQWSNGYTLPTADKLKIIAEHFEVSIDWLLGIVEEQTSDIDVLAASRKFGLSEWALRHLEILSKSNAQPMSGLVIDGIEQILLSPQGKDFFMHFALAAESARIDDKREIPFAINSNKHDFTDVFLPETAVARSVFTSLLERGIGDMLDYYENFAERQKREGVPDDGPE